MGNGPVQPPNWGFYCSTNWGKAKLSFACCSAILAIATLVNGWLKNMKITHKDAPFDHYEVEPNYKEVVAFCVGLATGVLLVGVAILIGLV